MRRSSNNLLPLVALATLRTSMPTSVIRVAVVALALPLASAGWSSRHHIRKSPPPPAPFPPPPPPLYDWSTDDVADFVSDLGFNGTTFAQENIGGVELAELVTEHDQALSSRGPKAAEEVLQDLIPPGRAARRTLIGHARELLRIAKLRGTSSGDSGLNVHRAETAEPPTVHIEVATAPVAAVAAPATAALAADAVVAEAKPA
jgi:hypothetical protein